MWKALLADSALFCREDDYIVWLPFKIPFFLEALPRQSISCGALCRFVSFFHFPWTFFFFQMVLSSTCSKPQLQITSTRHSQLSPTVQQSSASLVKLKFPNRESSVIFSKCFVELMFEKNKYKKKKKKERQKRKNYAAFYITFGFVCTTMFWHFLFV